MIGIEAFSAFVYKNFKTKNKMIMCIQNFLILILLICINELTSLIVLFCMLQLFITSEFADDGISNIYLYLQGFSLEKLVRSRVLAKLWSELILLCPVLILVMIMRWYSIFIKIGVVFVIVFFLALLKIGLQYRIKSRIIRLIPMVVINSMLVMILFIKLDVFTKIIISIITLLLVYAISSWILKSTSLENALIRCE